MCLLMWIFNVLDLMNELLHIWHLNGLSPECRRIWSVKWPWVVKVLTQPGTEQMKGFSPEWILKCVFKFPRSVKVFVHPSYGHSNGFSPVYRKFQEISFIIKSYMSSHVNVESIFPRIHFFTNGTLEWLVSWMNQFMSFKMTFGNKLFDTTLMWTKKWTITCLLVLNFN